LGDLLIVSHDHDMRAAHNLILSIAFIT